MNYQKLFESDISTEAAKAWRAQGKKVLGVICCHIPEEIFYAADVLPVRMRATNCVDSSAAETWMSSFSCSFARSILQYWMDGTYELDGFVASDGCLQAARVYDNAKYLNEKDGKGQFIMQIGAPRLASARTIPFYRAELRDLIEALEKLTGNMITDEKLKAAVAKYNEARALMGQIYALRKAEHPVISGEDTLKITLAYSDVPVEEYIELLKAFLADAGNREPITDKRVRLMVIGSALDNPGYLKVIEDKGGLVVHDALCYGSRPFNFPVEVDDKDVLASLADYYLSRIVCPRMLDNRERMQKWVYDTAKEFKVDGVVYQKMQYCECWGGEKMFLEPLLKEADIPMLIVDREEHLANVGQLAIRAEAFIEMIEKED